MSKGRSDSWNDFSGEADAVLQASEVHGDIHMHQTRRAFPPPRQLPLGPTRFVNRQDDLEELDALLAGLPETDGRAAVVVSAISGAPGVGKSALALHWAHRVRHRFPDGDLYVDMQGYGPVQPLSARHALEAFLRALDAPADAIPDSVEERAALFRSLLDGKRILLVIDNASSSTQVRYLLPASRECFAMVTSRSALPGLVAREGAARVTLDVLSPGESVQLLADSMGRSRVAAESSMAFRVAELCGHLPLALRVVGERTSSRPRLSLAELVDELVGEQNRLDALASAEDELSDTRAVFSWSYRALTSELKRAFRVLGLHAGPEICVEAAAALIGVGVAAAKRRLRALADVSLLLETSTNRYRLHDLLRSYSVERVHQEETQEERTKAVRRLLSWYLLTADAGRHAILPHTVVVPLVPGGEIEVTGEFAGVSEAMSWFDHERRNLLAALRQASDLGHFDITWKLAIVASSFFELRSYWPEWEDSGQIGLAAARALGDPLGESASLLLLGDAAWRIGRLDKAAERYENAAHAGHGLSVGWVEGFALRGLGLIHEEREDFDTASEFFESALRVFRTHEYRRGEGMCLLSLGKCARVRHGPDTAVTYEAEAVAIFEEIDDVWTVAWGKLALAVSLAEIDRPRDAIEHLREAADVFRAFKDRSSEAQASVSLGDLHQRMGESADARRCWAQAVALYEALGSPRVDGVRQRIAEA